MSEEMRTHLEMQTEANLAAGMSSEEARYAALRACGGVAQAQEAVRDERTFLWLENLWHDGRYALRRLLRNPGPTATMVLTLAVALGINSAVLSLTRAVLFRPASPADPDRLCSVYLATRDAERSMRPFSFAEVMALRQEKQVFAEVGAFLFELGVVRVEGDQQRSLFAYVSDGFFQAHEVLPAAGRFFTAEEMKPGAGLPVVVISASFVRRLGWMPANSLGRTIQVNGVAVTVVGVAPEGFSGLAAVAGPPLWLPLGLDRTVIRMGGGGTAVDQPGLAALFPVVRLQAGLTRETARAPLVVVAGRMPAIDADGKPRELLLTPLRRFGLGPTPEPRGPVLLVAGCAMALAGLVLAVACFNLAGLQLARGSVRRKEIAVRLALGAGRGRILLGLLLEDSWVVVAGGTLGLGLAAGAGRGLVALVQTTVPYNLALTANPAPDLWAVALTLAGSVGAILLFGLAPAWVLTRTDLVAAMKPVGSALMATRTRWWPRHLLTGAQVTLAVVLVFAAVLFAVGLQRAANRPPGFVITDRYVAEIDFGALKWSADRARQALLELGDDPQGLAALERFSFGTLLPYGDFTNTASLQRSDMPDGKQRIQEGMVSRIGPGYFATLGIPLLRGRDFTRGDLAQTDAQIVPIVIDARMAEELFGEEDPLGRRVTLSGQQGAEIVGVCGRHWMNPLDAQSCCWVFLPARDTGSVFLFAHAGRTGMSGAVVAGLLRERLARMDPELTVTLVRPLQQVLDQSPRFGVLRVASVVFGSFGLVAALLAVIGVFSARSYLVARRTPEIGIRLALGATTAQVLRLVLGQAVIQAAIACALGASMAVLVGRLLGGLFHLGAGVGAVLVAASALGLFAAVVVAAWVPAWRATKVDPLVALRAE